MSSHFWTPGPELWCQALPHITCLDIPVPQVSRAQGLFSEVPEVPALRCTSPVTCSSPNRFLPPPPPMAQGVSLLRSSPQKNVASLAKPRVWTLGDREKERSSCVRHLMAWISEGASGGCPVLADPGVCSEGGGTGRQLTEESEPPSQPLTSGRGRSRSRPPLLRGAEGRGR